MSANNARALSLLLVVYLCKKWAYQTGDLLVVIDCDCP
jgi:hypothetical protein